MNAPKNITLLLDGLSDGCFFINRDLHISYLNKKAAGLLGVTAGDKKLFQLATLFPAGSEAWFTASLNKAFESGQHLSAAGFHPPQARWLQAGIYPSAEGAMVLLRSQLQPEDETAKSEVPDADSASPTFTSANEGVWDWNLHTGELHWNYNPENPTGYDEHFRTEDINAWIDSIHPDDKQRVVEGINEAVQSGRKYWADQYRQRKPGGAVSHVHDSGYVLHDDEGKPYRVIGCLQDVTDRLAAEQALRESEERYRNLFERASDCIVVYDRGLNIVDVNFASTDFSGYSKQELKRMRVTDFVSPEELAKQPIQFDRMIAGETAVARRRVKSKSGALRMMDVSSKMLPDGNVMAILRDVTERTEAERELSNSEVRFRTLAENLPVGIFETDAKGSTTYVNSTMTEYTGLTFDQLMRTEWLRCVHPDDREKMTRQWEENLKARRKSALEYRMVSSDGTVRWVKGKSVPVFDKFGQFTGYQGTVTDVTKEEEAMQALAASEEKYRTLVEEAPDAIYIVGKDGRFATVNGSAGKVLGYTRNELMAITPVDLLFEEDLSKNPLRMKELGNGERVIVHRRVRKKNGGFIHAEFHASMLSDGRILVFARNITERILAQEALISEKNFSDNIINSLPGIFYLTDTAGNVLRWNKNFETVSGYSQQEIAAMKGWEFFDDEGRKLLKKKTDEVFARGKSEMETYFFTKMGQRIPYYFNGWKVIFGEQVCLIGVGIDITEKWKSAELLRQSYEDIRRLAAHQTRVRDDERRRIAREIHDELGQQLTAVKMDVSWIDKRLSTTDEPIKTKLKNIISLLDDGNGSVRRILTELNTGIVGGDGLLDALERQNQLFTSSTGVPVAFYTPEQNLVLSQEAAACIFRVYQESLTNIMRYAEANAVNASLQMVDGAVHVSIEDNGKGFNTTKHPPQNSFGILGMRERVLSQGGNFQVQSQKGRGTKVAFSVPANP